MSAVARSEKYRRWNDAIATEYFRPADAGRPVYLAVDDDELAQIARGSGFGDGEGADSFADAVRLEVIRGGDLFRSFLRESRTWRATAPLPPYIGLLALCVLAASRMATDPEKQVWSNDYYTQINQLLRLDPHAGRPQNFDELSRLWIDLARWLDDDLDGQRGRSAIRTHEHFVHIGYPISQCVLRAADRRRLPDFFRSAGLEPTAEVSGERLLALLRAWAARGEPLTSQGQQTVARATGALEENLTETLRRELANWDGELRDERGRRRADIVLLAERLVGGRRLELRLFGRRPDGFPVAGWKLPNDQPIELSEAAPGWYSSLPVKVTSGLLRHGLSLTSSDYALRFDGDLAIPLRTSFLPDAGWLSSRQATAVEEHVVLAHTSVETELHAFLRRNAGEGWRISRPVGDLPHDWVMADGVRIVSIPRAGPDSLRRLIPRLNTSMRLEGGLQLGRQLYLEGGEPDLWITIDDEAGAELQIDDRVARLGAGIVRFRLSEHQLPDGPHEIAAAGETRRFSSVRSFGTTVPDGAGGLAHVLERHGSYLPEDSVATPMSAPPGPGRVVVCGAHIGGADLPTYSHPPVVLRCGFRDYQVVGRHAGEVAATTSPDEPKWLSMVDAEPVPCQFFEFAPPFPAQLVIYRGAVGTKVRAASAAPDPPCDAAGSSHGLASLWAETILRAEEAGPDVPAAIADVWAEYVAAARIAGGSAAA